MEEKNATKIGLSTCFLILAIIVIIVMGVFIYKLNYDKTAEIQKSAELQEKVSTLTQTISNLQNKIDTISNTINSNSVTESSSTNSVSKNNTVANTETTNAMNHNKEKNNKNHTNKTSDSVSKDTETIENKILGSWKVSSVVDSDGKDLELNIVFGTGIEYSNEMQFKENGILKYMIGITASSDDGKYTVNGNTVKYGVPSDIKGILNWKTLTYFPEEDVLREEETIDGGKKQIITYTRVK